MCWKDKFRDESHVDKNVTSCSSTFFPYKYIKINLTLDDKGMLHVFKVNLIYTMSWKRFFLITKRTCNSHQTLSYHKHIHFKVVE